MSHDMAWKPCPRAPLRAALAAGLLACVLVPAWADEASYCVTCTNPDQTYRCRVNAGGSKPSDALKLYCIIRTAKEGHHGSCSAERASSTCNGVEKVYSYDGPMPKDLAADPRVKSLADKIEHNQKAFEKPQGDGPKTLVELTGRAVNASRQGWRNARGRLGGTSRPADQSLPNEPVNKDQSLTPLSADELPADHPAEARPSKMQRASSAVGGFARKSYRCVFSLFRKCSSETAEGSAPSQ
jgi:hypothetical protein